MTEWQPIETAPKDGKRILACDSKRPDHMGVISWDILPNSQQVEGWVNMHYDGDTAIDTDLAHSEINPTHWMHLPPLVPYAEALQIESEKDIIHLYAEMTRHNPALKRFVDTVIDLWHEEKYGDALEMVNQARLDSVKVGRIILMIAARTEGFEALQIAIQLATCKDYLQVGQKEC